MSVLARHAVAAAALVALTACASPAAPPAPVVDEPPGMVAAVLPEARLVGPDTGYAVWQEWLTALLPLVPRGLLHAVTHHVYLGMERSSFNSPALLDSPLPEIEWYAATVAALAPAAQIWAGENGVRLESPARGAHK